MRAIFVIALSLIIMGGVHAQADVNPNGNIIVKGKPKVLDRDPGGDVTIRCKGKKGNCLIVKRPEEKTVNGITDVYRLVEIYDAEGEFVEKQYLIRGEEAPGISVEGEGEEQETEVVLETPVQIDSD